MKVVLASGTWPPEVGGMATFVKNFAQAFAAAGHKISVIAYADRDYGSQAPHPISLISRKRWFPIRHIQYAFVLKWLARDANIIYAQDLVSSGFPAAVVAWLTRTPLVVRVGGDFLWEKMVERGSTSATLREYYDQPKSPIERIYISVYRFVLRQALAVIFNTQLQADLYKRKFWLPASKIRVIANPFHLRKEPKASFEGNLLFAGRFVRLKNIALLIKAFAKVNSSKKLLLVGSGPQEGTLRELVASLNLSDRVEFRRPVAHDDLQTIIAASSLIVVPSLTDLNPNLVLEALSLGVPALITRENGLPQEIGEFLQTFDPTSEKDLRDKLEKLLLPEVWTACQSRLSEIHFERTWDRLAAEHLQMFQQFNGHAQ